MMITEKDIQGFLTSFDGSCKLKVNNSWITLESSPSNDEINRALKYGWGIVINFNNDMKMVRLSVDKYRNADKKILDNLYGVRKKHGLVEDE